jgi:hypothetical protein
MALERSLLTEVPRAVGSVIVQRPLRVQQLQPVRSLLDRDAPVESLEH